MKRIIYDHLKRWWSLWLVIAIGYFFIVPWSVSDETFQHFGNIITFPMIFFVGVLPLSYDLQRGHSRALLALPLTARQLARAWWCVTVGLPALLLAAAAGLATLLHSAGTTGGFRADMYLWTCFTNTLWLGAAFFFLTIASGRWPDGPADYARRIVSVGFVALCILVVGSGDVSLGRSKGIVLMLMGAAMTIAGWFRAEHLVMQRAGVLAVSQPARKGRKQYNVQAGFGGLPFLLARMFTHCLLIGLLMLVIMVVMFSVLSHSDEKTGLMNSLHRGILSMGNSFQIWWLLLFQLLPTIMHIRYLRTLPLSAAALAATLVLVPAMAIISLGGLISALAGTGPDSAAIMSVYLMAASLGAVSVSVLVWRGVDRDGIRLFVVVLFSGAVLPMHFHAEKAPLLATISIASLLVASAFEVTRRVLIRSSRAYRVPPVNAWGMWRWRS